MSNNKYYTPSIEEFHVGFEYEGTSAYREMDGSEDVYKVCKFNLIEIEGFDTFKYLDTQLKAGLVRVKYLDKKDIESLGFILQPTENTSFGDITGEYVNETNSIHIYYKLDKIGVTYPMFIYKTVNKVKVKVFDGYVKNISELKVLLKQLGITDVQENKE